MDNTTAESTLPPIFNISVLLEDEGLAYLHMQQTRLRIGILVSYLVTMLVGLIGNGLVIYVVGKNSQIRNKSVANYYIWNLAFADLLFLLTMPFFCYSTFFNYWPFGVVVCKMAAAFKETMRYTSMFTLVALSFDRYLASFYNMGHLRTIKVGVIVCGTIWIVCGTIAVPYAMYAKIRHDQCSIMIQPSELMVFMTYFQLTFALLIPLLLICVSYTLLALRLRRLRSSVSLGSGSANRPSRKMTSTVLVVVITFIIWQTPYHVNDIVNLQKHLQMTHRRIIPTVHEILVFMYLNTISTILLFISSCCNPIIYGILNDNYRMLYTAALCRLCRAQPPPMLQESSGFNHQSTVPNGNVTRTYRFQITSSANCCIRRCFRNNNNDNFIMTECTQSPAILPRLTTSSALEDCVQSR